jgi:hypothetical protein
VRLCSGRSGKRLSERAIDETICDMKMPSLFLKNKQITRDTLKEAAQKVLDHRRDWTAENFRVLIHRRQLLYQFLKESGF